MMPTPTQHIFSRVVPESTLGNEEATSTTGNPNLASRHLTLVPRRSEQEQINDFADDLAAALDGITKSLESNQKNQESLKGLEEKLKERGFWSAITAKFGSETDQEILGHMISLCGTLPVVQGAIQVILKVQTQKNHLLKHFNNTLVDKIARIEGDTKTLDVNQRAAALAFLCELQYQIEDQLEQADLVQTHEEKIAFHGQLIASQQTVNSQHEMVMALQASALADLKESQEAFDISVDMIRVAGMATREHLDGMNQWRSDKDNKEIELRLHIVRSDAEIEKLGRTIHQYREELDCVAVKFRSQGSFKSVALRLAVPCVALIVAVSTACMMILRA